MTLKAISSVTTINPKARPSSTSTKPTETGYEIQLSSEQRKQSAARLLEINDPLVVDKRLVTSVESILGYRVNEISRTRFTDHGADIMVSGFKVEADTVEQVEQAIRAVLSSMAPLGVEAIESQLALLATLVVKPTGETPEDHSLRMRSLAMQLSDYPADIVQRAIKRVSETAKFWPSYAEFYEHIGWRVSKRQLLLDALERKRVDITA
jgi:hypothetical protein